MWTDNGFPKCYRAHVIISITEGCQFFMHVSPERSKVMGIQCWLSALPLKCRDFSRLSISFDDIMDCRWWNPYKLFEIVRWETLFLNRWTILPHSCSLSGEPLPILACERLSLSLMLFLDTHVFLINPFTCDKFQTGFFFSIPQLSQSFVDPVPTFLEPVAGIKFRMSVFTQKQ